MTDREGFRNSPYEKGTPVFDKRGNSQRVKENSTDVLALTYEGEPARSSFPQELRDIFKSVCREYIELGNPFVENKLPMYAVSDNTGNLNSVKHTAHKHGYAVEINRGEGNTEFHFFPQRSVGTINITRE